MGVEVGVGAWVGMEVRVGVVGVYGLIYGTPSTFPVRPPSLMEAEWGIPRPGCASVWGGGEDSGWPRVDAPCSIFLPGVPTYGGWRVGDGYQFGQGSPPRGDIVRVGRGPCQPPAHIRLTI